MKELRTQKIYQRTIVPTYNKNKPELFTKISSNLNELKNKDCIKIIFDTTKKKQTSKKLRKHSELLKIWETQNAWNLKIKE